MAVFILKHIHNLYWKNWYYDENNPNYTEKVLSGLDL